jgi:hypothetical protein
LTGIVAVVANSTHPQRVRTAAGFISEVVVRKEHAA